MCRCPLLGRFDTITGRDRQSATYAVALAALTGHSPSRCSREIGLRTVILGAPQHFAPVILHTALPEGLQDQTNAFVRLVPKQAGNFARLKAEIEDLFSMKMPQLHRAIIEHMDASLRDYMWKFVVANWKQFNPLVARPDFVRLVLHRLGSQLSRVGVGSIIEQLYPGAMGGDPDPEKVHPAEYYIKPPVAPDPVLGDLRVLERKGQQEIFVVLWPSCDLVLRGSKCKVERALCAHGLPLTAFEEFKKWVAEKKPSEALTKSLLAVMTNNRKPGQADRYHFLPAAWDIPNLVVDFQDLEHVEIGELRAALCLATLASPFAESIGARFIRYLGRLGTPDLDLGISLAALRPPKKA